MTENTLETRHSSEQEFHDQKYGDDIKETHYSMGMISIITKIMWKKLGNIKNKKVVDFGCGNGWVTKKLLDKGAEVWAFDISENAIDLTKELAGSINKLDKIHLEQMPAEELKYDDNMFDYIVGVAILHHLDLQKTADEIYRVLKKDGKAYFLEPLRHNPFINIFRKLTPHMRSKDEFPLHINDFKLFKTKFSNFEHEEYYLFTLLAFFWFFIIKNKKLFLFTRDVLFKFDSIFLKLFPFLKRYCWYSILIMEK